MLMLAQTERDVEDIRTGRQILDSEQRLALPPALSAVEVTEALALPATEETWGDIEAAFIADTIRPGSFFQIVPGYRARNPLVMSASFPTN